MLFLWVCIGCASRAKILIPYTNPSMCLAGMAKQWEDAGCREIQGQEIESGYIQYQCVKSTTQNQTNTKRYNAIMWLESRKQYAKPLTEGMVAICGDPHTILVEEKDEKP